MTSQQEPRGRTDEERAYYSLGGRVYAIFAHIYDAGVFPFRQVRREAASMEVVAIDLSEAMLRVAQRKNRFPSVSFQQGRRAGPAARVRPDSEKTGEVPVVATTAEAVRHERART